MVTKCHKRHRSFENYVDEHNKRAYLKINERLLCQPKDNYLLLLSSNVNHEWQTDRDKIHGMDIIEETRSKMSNPCLLQFVEPVS